MTDYQHRLDAVELRLRTHAERPADATPQQLTEADERTGERWQWGQVWAHCAEFVPYWMAQASAVIADYDGEPVPFGRVKSDAGRIAAIERDRDAAVAALWSRLERHIGALRSWLDEMPEAAWRAEGRHSTLGVMPLDRIVEEFLVGHLEEHAAQLDSLA